jgi:cytosine/adenosine deaminase-related metal-dependent hydrolase
MLHPGDAETLAARGAHVVHCPRSHAYFEHRPFARGALERAGVNVCLGTDSLATVHRHASPELVLDLFAEMREVLAHSPGMTPEEAVRLATLNSARALGCTGRAGVLAAGGWADAVAVPFNGALARTAEAVVQQTGDVAASMIAGKWVWRPGAASG